MLNEKAIFAGFGGQGIMKMGQMLAEAGMMENKQVSWLPSYGPEMRGGTANCHVIISDRMVGSPIVHRDASTVVVMNLPSLTKFETDLKAGGVLFVNTSLIKKAPERTDIEIVNVPATNIANELGNTRVANVVMLGAYVQKMGTVSMDTVKKIIEEVFGNKKELVALNIKALEKGAECVD